MTLLCKKKLPKSWIHSEAGVANGAGACTIRSKNIGKLPLMVLKIVPLAAVADRKQGERLEQAA